MKVRMKTLKFGAVLGLLLASLFSFAQEAHILYGFTGVAQSSLLNPADRGLANVTIGIPVINSINVKATSQLGAWGDLTPDTTGEGNDIIGKIEDMEGTNYLYQYNRVGLFFVGFNVGESGYVSLGADLRTETMLSLPSDLLKFPVLGNKYFLNSTADFSSLGLNTNQTLSYHIGYSQSFLDNRLRVGARFRYINGIAAVKTDITNLQYSLSEGDTVPFEQSFEGSGTIYTSGINAEDALLDQINSGSVDYNKVYGTNNVGIGFDLGINYKVNDQLNLTASVIDMGSINWTKGLETYAFNIDRIEFNGIDYNPITDTASLGDIFEDFIKDQEDKVTVDTTQQSFKTKLNSDIFIGAQYNFHEDHQAIILYQYSQLFDQSYQALSLSYYGMLTNWFHLKASYAYGFDGINNFGAGFALGTTVQLYLMGNYLHYLNDFAQIDRFSFRLGVNVNWDYPDVNARRAAKKLERQQRKQEAEQPSDSGFFLQNSSPRG
jgi:hypothetical protein